MGSSVDGAAEPLAESTGTGGEDSWFGENYFAQSATKSELEKGS
jgi:hypothetical protein